MKDKTNRFIIKYKEGIVSVSANDVAEAIERFKELRIETNEKELTIIPSEEMFKRKE